MNRVILLHGNGGGKAPEELKITLEWQDKNVENYRKQSAVIVDTARPVKDVVDEIVKGIAA